MEQHLDQLEIKPKYLFFVGHARSGSTLLGQIINSHPNCLVSNEFRALDLVIKESRNINDVMLMAAKDAHRLFNTGLENHKNYNIKRFQKKWKNSDFLREDPIFKKKQIQVIGDKKAGSTTRLYVSHKNKFLKFLRSNSNIFFIKIERNIHDTCKSYVKSHPHEAKDLAGAIEEISYMDNKSNDFLSIIDDKHKYIIKYEELINSPVTEISNVFKWLELSHSPEITNPISKLVCKG